MRWQHMSSNTRNKGENNMSEEMGLLEEIVEEDMKEERAYLISSLIDLGEDEKELETMTQV